jgi:rSAM/selenodomain-associated transferase 1
MNGQILVLAKAPVPGRVKTRLCPPCTPEQAAELAAAALGDTLDTVAAAGATSRVLVIDGSYPPPPGWEVRRQRGGPLGDRLANAFADGPEGPAVLVGMDTPQLTAGHLDEALRTVVAPGGPDAVLGLAEDGGWWALGLRSPAYAEVLRDIPTSTAETGARTLEALRRRGLRVAMLPVLRDVDTAEDAYDVAGRCLPGSRFARTLAAVR